MKTFRALILSFIFLAIARNLPAYGFWIYPVGYYNLSIQAGNNLIANQLYNTNNTLNGLFGMGTPEGATATKWDAASQQFLAESVYNSGSGWSINYDLVAGEGALFSSDSAFTNTFVGEVHGFDGEGLVFTYPTLSEGTYLLSCSGPAQADFFHVIGRDPLANESVRQLNATNQIYHTTTFLNGAWDDGSPSLKVGESAFFTLVSPVTVVPEPGIASLFACGFFVLGGARILRKRKI